MNFFGFIYNESRFWTESSINLERETLEMGKWRENFKKRVRYFRDGLVEMAKDK